MSRNEQAQSILNKIKLAKATIPLMLTITKDADERKKLETALQWAEMVEPLIQSELGMGDAKDKSDVESKAKGDAESFIKQLKIMTSSGDVKCGVVGVQILIPEGTPKEVEIEILKHIRNELKDKINELEAEIK